MNIPSHNDKYLETQLRNILAGIKKNFNEWDKNNQINNEVLLKIADELRDRFIEVKKNENILSESRKKLLEYINTAAKPIYKKARDQAYSLYGKSSDKLKDYSFKKI